MDGVSIVIPAFNEAVRLGASLPKLLDHLDLDADVEVIVVDDGSTDDTARVALGHLRHWPRATLVRLPWNHGKGGAVRAGVSIASGSSIVFMDADLSADLADLPRLVAALTHADVALGSRSVAGADPRYSGTGRRVSSKVFNDLACMVAGVNAADTQCGFKAFRAPTAKLLFHLSDVDGFAFDVEVLVLAQLLGLRVVEVPVGWDEAPGSTVRPLRDASRMVRDVLRVRRRAQQLSRLVAERVHPANGAFVDGPATAARWVGTPSPMVISPCARRTPAEPVLDLRDPAGEWPVVPTDAEHASRPR